MVHYQGTNSMKEHLRVVKNQNSKNLCLVYQWLSFFKNTVNPQAKRGTVETERMSDTGCKDEQKQRMHLLTEPAEIWNIISKTEINRRCPRYFMNDIKLTMEHLILTSPYHKKSMFHRKNPYLPCFSGSSGSPGTHCCPRQDSELEGQMVQITLVSPLFLLL